MRLRGSVATHSPEGRNTSAPVPQSEKRRTASSKCSGSEKLPSWLCTTLSYAVVLLHFGSSYMHMQRGTPHFATLHGVLIAVNAVYILAFRSFALQADGLLSPRKGLLPLDRQLQQLQLLQQLPASVPLSHFAWFGCMSACANICLSLVLPPSASRAVWESAGALWQFLLYLSFRYFAKEFMAFQCRSRSPVEGTHCPPLPLLDPASSFSRLFAKKLQAATVLLIEVRDEVGNVNPSRFSPLKMQGVVSFAIFGSSSLRVAASFLIAALALSVMLTGNVGFLPHLTVALCFSLMDDKILGVSAPQPLAQIYSAGCLSYFCRIWMRPGVAAPAWALQLCKELSLLCACNGYGLFSVVTTSRLELVIEELHQTADEKPQWLEITFPGEHGSLSNRGAISKSLSPLCPQAAPLPFLSFSDERNSTAASPQEGFARITVPHSRFQMLMAWRAAVRNIDSPPPWLWSGHFPRLDWRLWFVPLRLRCTLRGAVTGAPSSLSHAASQVYPAFWQSFIQQLCAREPAVLQLLGPQGEALKGLPPPMALKISLYDYRMVPPEGVPLYATFFPEGFSHLTTQEIVKLEKDLAQWTIGRWWMRRRHQEIEAHVVSEGCPPLDELVQ
ncbi:hypothetical protein cyc_01138 [Cyclospora cayetanensis]|uniref:Lipase maturation factor 1/2 N-terminal domain-containing protein n=1 Tax=Cyclospora cayetanensis TaxID=88456 RepID=A0A1D3D9Z1_9EIME|nr:hypothetical protein cyc_01138 [Cyclospora cayetanensis]